MNPKDLSSEIEELGNIKQMVQAYEEIAASYMRRIRNTVIRKRDFFDGLNFIFEQVKQSYKSQIEQLKKKKGMNNKFRRNGKTVFVYLSANSGLYGDIVRRTYNLFLSEVKKGENDVVIIGRLGKLLFENENLGKKAAYFDAADNTVDPTTLLKIVEYLVLYDKIIVFYEKFQNIVNQEPATISISGDEPARENSNIAVVKYLFEPSLEQILTFFENELIASIFEQTMHESHLAKFASRMITLDSATENIRSSIRKAELSHQRLKHAIQNKKQLSTLSGMSLWKR